MTELFPEIEINEDQAEAIARGLFVVARADGAMHEREAAMIGEFYASTTERASDLGALARAPAIEDTTLALALPTAELRRLFLKTAMLLAYTDGTYGAGESKVIAGFARAFEMSDAEVANLEVQVKEYLLSQLSHLRNVDAVTDVARKLKV